MSRFLKANPRLRADATRFRAIAKQFTHESESGRYPIDIRVRELKNVLIEAAAFAKTRCLGIADLPAAIRPAVTAAPEAQTSRRDVLDNAEAKLSAQALKEAGSVSGAALRLGLHQATPYHRIKKYGIMLSNRSKH